MVQVVEIDRLCTVPAMFGDVHGSVVERICLLVLIVGYVELPFADWCCVDCQTAWIWRHVKDFVR